MRNIKLFLFFIFTFLVLSLNVNAVEECSDEKINSLKKQVKNVSMVSEYNEESKKFGTFNSYIVTLYELPKGFYVLSTDNKVAFFDNELVDGSVSKQIIVTSNVYNVYSNDCPNQSLKKITLKLKKHNFYSDYPECDGIDEGELDVCNEFYDEDINYNKFVKIVNDYKNQKNDNNGNESKSFISSYLIVGISFLSIIIIVILMIRRYKTNKLD